MAAFVVDADHRDVTGSVAWCVDRNNAAVVAQSPASSKPTERTIVERERLGANPGGSG